MFKFLKDKIKGAVENISKEVEEETEVIEEEVEEPEEKKGFFTKLFGKEKVEEEEETKPEEETPKGESKEVKEKTPEKKVAKKKKEETPKEEVKDWKKVIEEKKEIISEEEPVKEEKEPEKQEEPQEKKGFFTKLTQVVTTTKLSEEKFNNIFYELELVLLQNNVAVEVIEKIKDDLKEELTSKNIPRNKLESTIKKSLKNSIEDVFDIEQIDLLGKIKSKKPFVISFIGINGGGKTTTLAKIIKYLQDNNLSCVVAACDTFRVAAIEQLEQHTDKLGVKLIKHQYGSDAAAVAFDAVKHAESKGLDVVLIDTAGRLHSNINLMDELKKIVRVSKPDLNIFIGESITGNDCVEQAKKFDDAVGIDGVILTKVDVDEKGGAAISVSYVTKKPILFLGTGQNYEDLKKFDKQIIIDSLEL